MCFQFAIVTGAANDESSNAWLTIDVAHFHPQNDRRDMDPRNDLQTAHILAVDQKGSNFRQNSEFATVANWCRALARIYYLLSSNGHHTTS